MIRVLHVVSSLKTGGIQSLLMNIYRTIDRKSVQFDFLIFSEDDIGYQEEVEKLGGKVFYINPRSNGIYQNRKDLIKFFIEHPEYKIVHQHVSTLSYVTPLKIASKFEVPVRVLHAHSVKPKSSILSKLLHYINKVTITKYTTDYFACSPQAGNWLFPKREMKSYKLINNGIEVSKFEYDQQIREEIRNRMGLTDHFVVGHIGRFSYPKNHDFIIDIFREINIEYINSRLLLIGDGNLKEDIKDKVIRYGLEDKVIFTGARHDTNDLLQSMDVFVFPSHYEGFGIVLLEAQASGIRCFASSKVIPVETNVTGLVKFIEKNKDASFWASEILKNKNYVRESKTKEISESGYDISLIANELERWYQKSNKY